MYQLLPLNIPGRLSRVSSKGGHPPSGGWSGFLPVSGWKDKVRPGSDPAVSCDRVTLYLDHLTLTERPLVTGFLQRRWSGSSNRGQRAEIRSRLRLVSRARQAVRQYSSMTGRSGVSPRQWSSSVSSRLVLVGVCIAESSGRRGRVRDRGIGN